MECFLPKLSNILKPRFITMGVTELSADDQKTFAQFEEKFKNCFYSNRDTNQPIMGLPREAFIVNGRFRGGYRLSKCVFSLENVQEDLTICLIVYKL